MTVVRMCIALSNGTHYPLTHKKISIYMYSFNQGVQDLYYIFTCMDDCNAFS